MGKGWSDKYKKSIDCDNPKGFSQRAHCQGKKKMNEEGLRDWFGKSKSKDGKSGWVNVVTGGTSFVVDRDLLSSFFSVLRVSLLLSCLLALQKKRTWEFPRQVHHWHMCHQLQR